MKLHLFSDRTKMAIFIPKYFLKLFGTPGWILFLPSAVKFDLSPLISEELPWICWSINEMRA